MNSTAAAQQSHSSEYAKANEACRRAFEEEEGYGHPEANPQRYQIFRDGFFAAWNLANKESDANSADIVLTLSNLTTARSEESEEAARYQWLMANAGLVRGDGWWALKTHADTAPDDPLSVDDWIDAAISAATT